MKLIKIFILFLPTFIFIPSLGQSKFIINTQATDSLIAWFNNGCKKIQIDNLVTLPGNQFMEQLLLKEESATPKFKELLTKFIVDKKVDNNYYLLNDAYKDKDSIAVLLDLFKLSNLTDNLFNYDKSFFPSYYKPDCNFEFYFSPTGWKWGDAMTFNYNIVDGKYKITEEGNPAMIFNLTLMYKNYGSSNATRLKTFNRVASHELFHSMFSDFRNQYWTKNNRKKTIENQFYLFLLDEGIAHYVADGNMLKEKYYKNDNLRRYEKTAFLSFADSAKIVFNTHLTEKERFNTMDSGLYGKYWNKYLCITGLFMAYHLDCLLGKEALRKSIEQGPEYFIKTYISLQKKHKDLCPFPLRY